MSKVLFLLLLLSFVSLSVGHLRLKWPSPRSMTVAPRPGAPCGGDMQSMGEWTKLKAGQKYEIEIYEMIHHNGQPFRIALSEDGRDSGFDDCILINHVPQHTENMPYNLTIEVTIPDVTCKECTLQLINFDTSALTAMDECCNIDTDCPTTNYYSCANVEITGGKWKRDDPDVMCYQPSSWPYREFGCDYYREESNGDAWQMKNGRLYLKTNAFAKNMEQQCTTGLLRNADDTCSMKGSYSSSSISNSQKNAVGMAYDSEGEMEAGGVIAILIVLCLIAGIVAAHCYGKNKGNDDGGNAANGGSNDVIAENQDFVDIHNGTMNDNGDANGSSAQLNSPPQAYAGVQRVTTQEPESDEDVLPAYAEPVQTQANNDDYANDNDASDDDDATANDASDDGNDGNDENDIENQKESDNDNVDDNGDNGYEEQGTMNDNVDDVANRISVVDYDDNNNDFNN